VSAFIDEIEKRLRYHQEAIHGIADDPNLELLEKDITSEELIHELEENMGIMDTEAQCDMSYHSGSIGALLFVTNLLGREYPDYEPYCDILE